MIRPIPLFWTTLQPLARLAHALAGRTDGARKGLIRSVTAMALLLMLQAASAETFYVTSTADSALGPPGSLRLAIMKADLTTEPDVIEFNLPPSGPLTIKLSSDLPIKEPVTIDGLTQPGPGGFPTSVPVVELDGGGIVPRGLVIEAGSSTVRGLVINGFTDSAIVLKSKGGNTISNNRIGTDVTGKLQRANGTGILIDDTCDNNVIGGTARDDGNLISGNTRSGIMIRSSSGNRVQGNLIGTSVDGKSDVANGTGVHLMFGLTAGAGFCDNNRIGGTEAGATNVISGNTGSGVVLWMNVRSTLIQGNIIGLDADGAYPLPNGFGEGWAGVELRTEGTSGPSSTRILSNVVCGNHGSGVLIYGSFAVNNVVQGNYIGTDASGTSGIGNQFDGVAFDHVAQRNLIGGVGASEANRIAHNGRHGVNVFNGSVNNTIVGNSIFGNGGLGISLGGGPGVTFNDFNDLDGGPNNLQNFPDLTVSSSSAGTTISGSLNSRPNRNYHIDVYRSIVKDPSNHGEGESYVGRVTTSKTDSGGNVDFTLVDSKRFPGQWFSATATDAVTGDTSEFSPSILAPPPPPPPPCLMCPPLASVDEIGGDAEATDTVTAKWTGVTFTNGVANEPVPGRAAGEPYTVGFFGNHAPAYVDRNHRYTNASDAIPMPPYLVGQEYIMSGNDNRDNADYRLDVDVVRDVQVYLLIDNRLGDADNTNPPAFDATHMQWVLDEGWVPVVNGLNRSGSMSVPDEVGIDESADGTINQWFSVYTKRFFAGTFQLKQADNTGQNMYGVVVAPASPYNFNDCLKPPGTGFPGAGNAGRIADDGTGSNCVVHLTDANQGGVFGVFSIPAPAGGSNVDNIHMHWRSLVGGDTGAVCAATQFGRSGADGYSLSWGNDLPNPPSYGNPGEEGAGTGLIVTVDTFDNGNGKAPGLEIKWGGARVAFDNINADQGLAKDFLRKGVFVEADLTVDSAGHVTFTYDGRVLTAVLANWSGVPGGGCIMFGARTGGACDNHWIDDLVIEQFALIPPFPVITALVRDGQLHLLFPSLAGRTYTIEGTDSLPAPGGAWWTPVNGDSPLPGTGETLDYIVPMSGPQKFFRVRENP